MLDSKSILLLRKIFLSTLDGKEPVDARRFRADHFEDLALIESLEKARHIDKRDDKYSLMLSALPLISDSTPQAKRLLEYCERLLITLRVSYQEKLGDPLSVRDLAAKSGLDKRQVSDVLVYMAQAPVFGGQSLSFYDDDAYVQPSEGVLRYRTFADAIQEIQGWSTKIDSLVGSRSIVDMFKSTASQQLIEFDSLIHPTISKHAIQKFRDGHLRNAVLDSVIAVFDLIRQKTGLVEDGDELVGKAFSLAAPYLILSEIDTESGKNDQKGFIQVLRGVYQGVRNPKAHSLESDLDEMGAAQYLVLASLLARRIDEAQLVNQPQINNQRS